METDQLTGQPPSSVSNPPQELWFLKDCETGNFILAIDCKGDPLLVFRSFDDAMQSADVHKDLYDIDCEPHRVTQC